MGNGVNEPITPAVRARRPRSIRRRRSIAEELHTVAQQIIAERSVDDVLASVLCAARKVFGTLTANIFLAEQTELFPHRCLTVCTAGQPQWDDPAAVPPREIAEAVQRTGQPVIVTDPGRSQRFEGVSALRGTYAAVPIRHGDDIIGVLLVNWEEHRQPGRDDLHLLETLAAYGAIAIANARLRAHDLEARLEAEKAHRRMRQFLGMVAHDLRAPLGVVATSLELLKECDPANMADVEQDLRPATENAIRRIQRLIDDLLGAARISEGRFYVRPFPMDLVDVAKRVIEQYKNASAIHEIVLDAPDQLTGEWDPDRIAQLLTNFLSNAIKYSPEGGEVRLTITPAGNEVIIQVSDQGIGIDRERSPLVFEAGVRLNQDPEHEGLGLGLYIARAIAESHGGRIWVESQLGQGTSFYLALPLKRDALPVHS